MTAKGFYWRGRFSYWRLLLVNSSMKWFFSLYSCIFTCKWVILLGHQRTARKLKINSHCPRLSQVLGLNKTDFICLVFYFSLYFLTFWFLSIFSFSSFALFYTGKFICETFQPEEIVLSNFVEDFDYFCGHFCLQSDVNYNGLLLFFRLCFQFYDCYLWGKQFYKISFQNRPLKRKDGREK